MRPFLIGLLLSIALVGTTASAALAPANDDLTEAFLIADGLGEDAPRCASGEPVVAAAANPGLETSSTAIPFCTGFALLKNPLGHVQYTITSAGGTYSCDWPPQAASACSGTWTADATTTITMTALTEGSVVAGVASSAL